MNDLSSDLKKLYKEKQINSKVSRRKKIIKVKAEVSGMENKPWQKKNIDFESLFFERIDKIFKLLAGLIKTRREKAQITIMRIKAERSYGNEKDRKRILRMTSY